MPSYSRPGCDRASRFASTARKIPRQLLPLVFCFLSAELIPTSRTAAQNDGSLVPGSSIVRQISGGETQTFQISLKPRQLLRLSIEKGDLNLSSRLYRPTGQQYSELRSQFYEPLDLSIASWTEGVYKLELTSLETEKRPRSFELKIEPLRTTIPTDVEEEAARAAVAAASVSRAEWKESSLRKAIEKYRAAEATWVSVRNFKKAAGAAVATGEVYLVLGDHRAALDCFQRAANEIKHTSNQLAHSLILSSLSRVWSLLGNNAAAEKNISKALTFYQQGASSLSSAKYAYAELLIDRAEIFYSKGDVVKSSADVKRALELFAEVNDRAGQARAHLYIAYIASAIGQPQTAVTELSQALALYQEAGDLTGAALCRTALGLSHSLKGEEEQAIAMHRQAREVFQAIGDRHSEAITLNALGQAYEHLKDFTLALANYNEALKIFESRGSIDFSAVAIFQIAGVYRLMGNNKLARSHYEKCLRYCRAAGKSRMGAYALNGIVVTYTSDKNRRQTLRQYDRILRFHAATGDKSGRAQALNDLGDFLLTIGEKHDALSHYEQALPLTRQIGNRDLEISTLYNLARACRDLGRLEEGLGYIEQSIDMIEMMRSNVASPDFRATYFAGFRKQYDLYIDLLMKLDRQQLGKGFATTALLASENARARTLLEIITEARVDIRQGADPKILQRERELQGLLQSQAQYQMKVSSRPKNEVEAAEVARQIEQLREEYQQIQTQLRSENPHLLSLIHPPKPTLEEIQKQLDPDTLLLEYALGDQESYLWAVTADSVSSYELPSRTTLEGGARELYDLIVARQSSVLETGYQAKVEEADRHYGEKALNLSKQLLGPAKDLLKNKRLLIVAEGILQYVPWDALPVPQQGDSQALITQHEIITLPSISTLAARRLDRPPERQSNRIVAVLADPVFDPDDDRINVAQRQKSSAELASNSGGLKRSGGPIRLTHTAAEADAILATTPSGAALIAKGFDANREAVMSQQVSQYQILHFATHGIINTEFPELSGILLSRVSRDGKEVPGFLQLHDIYNLNLSTELTVLSACDTALGKDIKGEGLIGLTRGFMHAGSRSVVATLWKVDDQATAELMGYFYTAMLQDGLSPAAALRYAKQRMSQHQVWNAPYYWAGFVIQGEYNQQINVGHRSRAFAYAALGVFTGVLILLSVIALKRRAAHV